MKKYPKEWLGAVRRFTYRRDVNPADMLSEPEQAILDRLQTVGALKEIPKQRERWECDVCGQAYNVDPSQLTQIVNFSCNALVQETHKNFIHFVEVTEE